ncbi:MAG: GHKL domain-containing protein [Deltaproteobacteria bacterium]|nr:GHKL domain-containing protein [Deltaproteobacteria bacterium]
MWKRISLRLRIYFILAALIFITSSGGLVLVWYTYQSEKLLTYLIDKNLAAFQVSQALETALVNQKGFVSYFFLDGNPDWLRQLGEYRQIFRERLKEAYALLEDGTQKEALQRLEGEYNQYIALKDQVIHYYQIGERTLGAELHKGARIHFFQTLEQCEAYRDLYAQRISQIREQSLIQARQLRIIAGSAIVAVLLLSVILAFILIRQILEPVRRLITEADRERIPKPSGNEVKALHQSVRGLIEDIDQTHLELEKSRESLLQSEKMAVVGKLAAGVAHSIRNPLTSVKMRLFSLGRTLNLPVDQKEDFDVISEEINHIETIVQNFLEFSRPPKLKLQQVSPSDVMDLVLQLLRHRLESSNVEVKLLRRARLPEIQLDPEQIKEVFVNLIVNACEAMDTDGVIEIQEEEAFSQAMGSMVIIRIKDNGSGVPESIKEKMFQPFYTSKEEGTGLGLSIVQRIIENHHGRVEISSNEETGTTFIISLPLSSKIT